MTAPADSSFLAGIAAAGRLGGFDPLLNAARIAAVAAWGPGIAAMVAASALRFPSRVAVIDETRSLTYRDLDRRATNLAADFRDRAGEGSVGILCRNHAGFVLAQLAAERAGVDVVMLSTALPAPKLGEVLARENVAILVADDEFRELIDESATEALLLSADGDDSGPEARADVDSLFGRSEVARPCRAPRRRSRLVLLTSGTTGPPKGARRANRAPRLADAGLLVQVPYRLGDTFYVAPPLFHAWGLSQATTALATASTLILRRKFDAEDTLELMAERRIGVLAVVPLMLRRILNIGSPLAESARRPGLVLSSGNVLAGPLALQWMDRYGDRLYNLYGSTEAAIGTIAGPGELRASPGTVGRPPRGVTLSILDEQGMPMPPGKSGRVFLSSSMQFTGYTDGSSGERSGTMLATGDLGYVDDTGLLYVNGRANDMIVTGGENVFPSRVEEVLDQLPEVEMSAVVGIDDDEYGQRVVAFVVPRSGRSIDGAKLRSAAAKELQSFMVPKEFVAVEALPMTTTGKVIRHRLAVLGDAKRV
ncbi:MAG: AMP-binding protein [Acidimicrobiales bacterium]